MAKVICVLYDDPVDGYPKILRPRRPAQAGEISRRADAADPQGDRFQARPACWAACRASSACASSWKRPGHSWSSPPTRTAPDCRLDKRAARRRDRHLAAVLARLHDGRADRQGPQAEADHHGRHRLRPHRPAGGHGSQRHRRRGHLLQQHQRGRARRDDDPGAGPQLHPLAIDWVVKKGWNIADCVARSYDVEGMDVGTVRRRPHRPGGAAAAQAVRREAALHRSASPAARASRKS